MLFVIGVIILIFIGIVIISPLIDGSHQVSETMTLPTKCIGGKTTNSFNQDIIAALEDNNKPRAITLYLEFLECYNPDEINLGDPHSQNQINALCDANKGNEATSLYNVVMYDCTYSGNTCNYNLPC